MLQEDVLDGGLPDLVSEVHDVIPDSRVPPMRILLFESNHQVDDFPRDPGAPGSLTVRTAVVLLGDESAIPAKHGLWRE